MEIGESGQKEYSVPKIVFRKTAVMLPLMALRWGHPGGFSLTNRILVSEDLGFRSLSVRLSYVELLARIESLGCRGLEPMTSRSAAGLVGWFTESSWQCRGRKDASRQAVGTDDESISNASYCSLKLSTYKSIIRLHFV